MSTGAIDTVEPVVPGDFKPGAVRGTDKPPGRSDIGIALIFILPSEVDSDRFRRWRRTVNTWQAGSRVSDVSHAHSG